MPDKPQWRHHYVPEFYLKRWQLGGDRLVHFHRPHGPEVRYQWVSPKQTGYLDKLYFLGHLPEPLRNLYERQFFTRVDSRAALVLSKLEAGDFRLSGNERSAWSRFVMSLIFRNPETLAALRHRLTEDVFRPTAEDERQYRQRRRAGEPRTLHEALSGERDENYISQLALQVLAGMADNPKIGSHFINMRWGYRVMPFDTPAILTSDRPIMWAQGMAEPDCHIVLPTGPKSIFWASNGVKMAALLDGMNANEMVTFLNEHATRRAVTFVWSAGLHDFDFVRQHMGVNPPDTIPDQLIRQQWEAVAEPREARRRAAARSRSRR